MYLVQFTNLVYTKSFDTLSKAIQHMKYANFEASLMTVKGDILGQFSPISGLTMYELWSVSNV